MASFLMTSHVTGSCSWSCGSSVEHEPEPSAPQRRRDPERATRHHERLAGATGSTLSPSRRDTGVSSHRALARPAAAGRSGPPCPRRLHSEGCSVIFCFTSQTRVSRTRWFPPDAAGNPGARRTPHRGGVTLTPQNRQVKTDCQLMPSLPNAVCRGGLTHPLVLLRQAAAFSSPGLIYGSCCAASLQGHCGRRAREHGSHANPANYTLFIPQATV